METTYTAEELDEFRDLVEGETRRNQMERIRSRLALQRFVERVGRKNAMPCLQC